ncbi:TRAP transporter large permease [Neomoorella thermoacetica]|nr:TRAP transporter large permease [Moorella thermoacetica]
MSPTVVLLGSFFLLIALGVPIALALGLSSVLAAIQLGIPMSVLVQRMVVGVDSFPLLAIPFFILAGEIMNEGGISRRLIQLANVLVGRVRGGLAIVNILTSMFFGGISGSAVADASSIGSILIPMMKEKGYDDDYAVAVTVTGATQGIIIPPSHNMIIYSLMAGGVSVGALFLAGFVPGALLGLSLMVGAYIIAVRRNYPREDPVSASQAWQAVCNASLGLMTALIVVGGVITGVATATESAGIAVVYAFLVTYFVYRGAPIRTIVPILRRTIKTFALVMFLIATSSSFAWLMAYLKIPAQVSAALLSLSDSRVVILLVINAILLVLGCIMDVAPIIVITTPILLPIARSIGMDPVHYGIMMMVNMAIGLVTPPVGASLFVGCAVGKVPIERVAKTLLPFIASMIVMLLLITFVPQVVMFMPNLLMGPK